MARAASKLPLGVKRAAKTPVSTTTGLQSQGSCVEHSRKEEAILILSKVIRRASSSGGSGRAAASTPSWGSLPGHPLGDWLVCFWQRS